MRIKKFFNIVVLSLIILLTNNVSIASADIVTIGGSVNRAFPWYSYISFGVLIIIVSSLSLTLIIKNKRKPKQKNKINRVPKINGNKPPSIPK